MNWAVNRVWQHSNIKLTASDTLAKATEFAFLGPSRKLRRTRTIINVKWNQPPANWYKLNSDGSSLDNPGRAGGGGIIRNSNSEWVAGYARAIGCTTNVAAKLWALRDGLNICINLNLPAVEVELDAKLVVDLLGNENSGLNGNDVLIANCKERLKQIPRVKILHYFREANKRTDALARRGALLINDFVIFFSFLPDVLLLANLDATGIMYERYYSNAVGF